MAVSAARSVLSAESSTVAESAEFGDKYPNFEFVNGKYVESARPYDTFRDQCTSIIVGRKASQSGFPITSHSNDCADCDIRMAYVPAKNHTFGSMRAINNDIPHLYPRRVEFGRADIYEPLEGQTMKHPIGYIPQVNSTYALWESSYPLINEHGLAFGESTTEAKSILALAQVGKPDPRTGKTLNGTALFTISQLMQVALERCTTAICAIETMGALGEEFGFAGEGWAASEMVSIIDKENAWVFEITGSGEGAPSAIWIARRVPEDHVAVIANFIITREIDFEDSENFKYSKNLIERTVALGLYNGKGAFDFQSLLSAPLANMQWYDSLRRTRIYSKIAPSLGMQPTDDLNVIPFSVKPDTLVADQDVMDLFRDHYEGTEFDQTQGALSGMFGNPNVELTGRDMAARPGIIPRSLSLMRTAYTSVSTSGPRAVCWFSADAPATSVFVPFFADSLLATGSNGTYSPRFASGIQSKFDRFSANWAFNLVANYMNLNYHNMSAEYVFPARDSLQAMVIDSVAKMEKDLANNDNQTDVSIKLGELQTSLQNAVVASWWGLSDLLIVRYNDGYFNFPEWAPNSVKIIEIPLWFMDLIGFNDSFLRPVFHWFVPFTGTRDEAIEFARANGPLSQTTYLGGMTASSVLLALLVTGIAMFAAGIVFAGKRHGNKKSDSEGYARLIA